MESFAVSSVRSWLSPGRSVLDLQKRRVRAPVSAKSLRRTVIHLHDFFSAVISGICDKDKSANGLLGFGHTLHHKGELCVGKSESERVAYAFCRIPKVSK